MADREISNLPELEALTDDTLIPVYQPGAESPAQSMTGAQIREFADAVAAVYAERAESAAQDAATGAAEAVAAAVRAEAAAEGAQSDWNQNDSTAVDYVKNRPFYSVPGLDVVKLPNKYLDEEFIKGVAGSPNWNDITDNPFAGEETIVLAETRVETSEGMDEYIGFLPQTTLVAGEKYNVRFNGYMYECTAVVDGRNVCIGNKYVQTLGREGEDTGEPFYIMSITSAMMQIYTMTAGTNYVGISQPGGSVTFEEWVFELEDGTTVTKQVVVK